MRKKWTEEEISMLQKLYEVDGLGWVEIAPIFKRTAESVHNQCKRCKLHHTEEQEQKLRSRIHSGERNGMWEKTGPNLGLTKETSERIKRAAQVSSETKKRQFATGELERPAGDKNGMWGKHSWRLGQTVENNDKVRLAGQKCSISQKAKWQNLPEDEKERRRRLWASQGLKCKKKRTSIELIVDGWLNDIGIEFQSQVQMGRWVPDFYIPSLSTVVECDGDYWHCNPIRYDVGSANIVQMKNINRDLRKDVFLKSKGIRVIRLWEREINSGDAKKILISVCNQGAI